MAVMGLLEAPPSQTDSTPAEGQGTEAPSATSPKKYDASTVKRSLLQTLLAKNNASVWDSAGSGGAPLFRVVALEKSHLFPSKKRFQAAGTHSPLSPLTPNSPLHPDGIMSPLWINRHKEVVPSVLVGFYELWDKERPDAGDSQAGKDPLGMQVDLGLERERDLILCSEINEKKRNAAEKNIKFVIVLLLKPNHIDDSRTEERISFIRKQCSVDAKNALFVLPPGQGKDGTAVDLDEFVNMMQKSLYEASLNYYREHTKRIKKKKARLPDLSKRSSPISGTFQPNMSSPSIASPGGVGAAKPLTPLGWSVRYEYKMAVFAEFRQDVDNAISHYETAYQQLVDLFTGGPGSGVAFAASGSTGADPFLQPFTPRWQEARRLADCINLKICKLYLYADIPVPALKQLHKHLNNFRTLPEFAGPANAAASGTSGLSHLAQAPNGGSFEYWSWVSTQYRVFGELIEIATGKIGLKVPFPPPGSMPSTNSATGQAQSLINTISNTAGSVIAGGDLPVTVFGPFSASNPAQVVQHAGYYYFLAAKCAEERWKRFRDAEAAVVSVPPLPPSAAILTRSPSRTTLEGLTSFPPTTPIQPQLPPTTLTTERTTDHGALTIELLTKSYEQFKKHKSGRMTLYLASEIARVYEESGKFEMSLKFFERIGKTYRKEGWVVVLRSILVWSVRCARSLGIWGGVVEGFVELLSERMTVGVGERREVLEALFMVLRGEDPGGLGVDVGDGGRAVQSVETKPVNVRASVDMDQINRFITCGVQLKKGTTYAGAPARFQVVLSGNGVASPPVALRVAKVFVRFSDEGFDHCFVDGGVRGGVGLQAGQTQFVDCTGATKQTMAVFAGAGDEAKEKEVWSKEVDLEFLPGVRKVLEGEIVPFESQDLKILGVSLIVEPEGGVVDGVGGSVCLDFKISERAEDTTSRRKWFVVGGDGGVKATPLDGYGELTSLRVIRRQPNIAIEINHAPPGYLDEVYPIEVVITNNETDKVQAVLDVEFRASGTDGVDTTSDLSLTPHPTTDTPQPTTDTPTPHSNLSHDLDLGIIPPGTRITRSFYLRATRNAGERVLYTTIIYRSISSDASPSPIDRTSHEGVFRKGETVRVAFGKCFEERWEVGAQIGRALEGGEGGEAGLLAGDGGEGEGVFERVERYFLVGSLKCLGPWDLEVGREVLVGVEGKGTDGPKPTVKIVPVSQPGGTMEKFAWKANHVFNFAYNVEVKVDALAHGVDVQVGSLAVQWRRKREGEGGVEGGWSWTTVPIPKIVLGSEDIRVFS
ncbi:hypothetical protein HDV00_001387, partial [Rhizophlyctis rosea]